MRNFIPERMVRATGRMMRDEHRRRRHLPRRVRRTARSARCRPASSPSATIRASKRASTAARARSSAGWSRRPASARRCARPRPIRSSSASSRCRRAAIRPAAAAQESWRTLFYANLISSFIGEILSGDEAQRRGLRRRRLGAGSHQRRRAVVPRAPMGVAAVGAVMLDAFFESYYRLRPVNATFTGVHEHDHRLPDWSPEGLAAARRRDARAALGAGGGPTARRRRFDDVVERDRAAGDGVSRHADRRARERPLSARQPVARGRRGDLRHRSR